MATMKDVAKAAGVSLGTVSKVVNQKPVNRDNQKRVEDAIKKLNYEVNEYARAFKIQKTNTVALIVPDLINPFFSLFAHYISQTLMDFDYKLLLCNSLEDTEKEEACINMAKQNKVDGIIGITYNPLEDVISEDLPYISLDRHFSKSVKCVSSDNYEGGKIAAKKLISTGCKSLAFIRTGSSVLGETLKRGEGFIDMSVSANIPCERFEIYLENPDAVRNKVDGFLRSHMNEDKCEIDGIFTSSDHLALQVVQQIKELGMKVPQDIQVIGYDGLRQLNINEYIVSSIKQPIDLLAKQCVVNLLKLINHEEDVPDTTILPVEFVDGGTTK